jgi:hypothetical protein
MPNAESPTLSLACAMPHPHPPGPARRQLRRQRTRTAPKQGLLCGFVFCYFLASRVSVDPPSRLCDAAPPTARRQLRRRFTRTRTHRTRYEMQLCFMMVFFLILSLLLCPRLSLTADPPVHFRFPLLRPHLTCPPT